MRVSTIDVGTNTVRLLVADVEGPGAWRVVTQHQTVTRLGERLAASGALGEAPMGRTLAVVVDYVARATDLGAVDVRIVATSAMREAANGRAFADAIERATGRRVQVVSGEDEARLTLRGVRSGLGRLDVFVAFQDVTAGGGSRGEPGQGKPGHTDKNGSQNEQASRRHGDLLREILLCLHCWRQRCMLV